MEDEKKKDRVWKLLIESINDSTEQLYKLRQREINLLQKLLEREKQITMLIEELANARFKPDEEKDDKPNTA